MTTKAPLLFVSLLFFLFDVQAQAQSWKVQTSGLDTNLRSVSAAYVPDANAKGTTVPVVWTSGSNSVILKSPDGGETWQRLHVTDDETLDFRGIVAFNASTAYVMSSGEGDKSRIYKTTNGGETWILQFFANRKEFFLDSIACLSDTHCFALGDPIDGKFVVLGTNDGEHWGQLATYQMPASLPREGAFAASNSCLALYGEEIFFVTGGPAARVFHSKNSGRTWSVMNTPVAHGNASSGIFSIARARGDAPSAIVVVGGNYQDSSWAIGVAAFSADQGKTWKLSKQQPGGFRSAVAPLGNSRFVAVGPNGEEISEDGGIHWKQTDFLNLNALMFLDDQHGWAVGPNGTIARFTAYTN